MKLISLRLHLLTNRLSLRRRKRRPLALPWSLLALTILRTDTYLYTTHRVRGSTNVSRSVRNRIQRVLVPPLCVTAFTTLRPWSQHTLVWRTLVNCVMSRRIFTIRKWAGSSGNSTTLVSRSLQRITLPHGLPRTQFSKRSFLASSLRLETLSVLVNSLLARTCSPTMILTIDMSVLLSSCTSSSRDILWCFQQTSQAVQTHPRLYFLISL